MPHMFLDESGDLGFSLNKKGASKYFLIVIVFTEDAEFLHKIIKKVIRELSVKNRKKHSGVLHAYKEKPKTRKKLLEALSRDMSLGVYIIYVNKVKVSKTLRLEKHTLYYLIIERLLKYIYNDTPYYSEGINLFLSKRETNKFLNIELISKIKNNIKNDHGRNVNLYIESTSSNKGLQAVDIVSWAVFRKYEHGDVTYYNLIKDKIIAEIIFVE